MFARASLVLLLVLNVGVAAWWATRGPPSAPAAIQAPPGVARLQLAGEVAGPTAAAVMPPTIAAPDAPASATLTTNQCFSFGPFPNDQAAVAAQARLQPLAQRIVVREQQRGAGRGWRVMLAPLPSTGEATATAERIAAAGFSDYFVVRDGDEANAIALGRYGNEAAARRRADALIAAGFPVRAEPLGGTVTWLDVRAAAGFDPSAAQQRAVAPERREIDCAALP